MPDYVDMFPAPARGTQVGESCYYCNGYVIYRGPGSVMVSANPPGYIAHVKCIRAFVRGRDMWAVPRPQPKSFTAPKGATHG